MPRFVSVWLKSWPLVRHLRELQKTKSANVADGCFVSPEALSTCEPFVLVAPGAGGARLAVLNEAARGAGLVAGDLLSNARSKVSGLRVAEADPDADRAALEKLGLWCQRYTPLVMAWDATQGADGLYLEVKGSAHLFDGEDGLLSDLARRLQAFGVTARLAIADTPGAAWAVSHHGRRAIDIVPPGEELARLEPLPLAALRLPAETLALARRLGLRRIGDLMRTPRAPLTKRFGALLVGRLDQALGRVPEPLKALSTPPCYHVRASFLEPISCDAHIVEAAERLFSDLAVRLVSDGVGVKRLMLLLFEPSGSVRRLEIGLAAPSRDSRHIARLLKLRLDRMAGGLETELGYEAMGFDVLHVEAMNSVQTALATADAADATRETEDLAMLVDRLEQRLGCGAVVKLEPVQSHIPERSVVPHRPGDKRRLSWERSNVPGMGRPLLIFPRPEPAEVLALIPEGPPRQFRWRGMLHQVAFFEGPERIAPEWWRLSGGRDLERDYYAVEDTEGRRFWLFRAGRYGIEGVTPRWLLHGIFA